MHLTKDSKQHGELPRIINWSICRDFQDNNIEKNEKTDQNRDNESGFKY